MGASCTLGDRSVSWASWSGGKAAPAARKTPGAWEIEIDNGAGTFALKDCLVMRGPVTRDLGDVTGSLGRPYVAAKIDTETHAVTAGSYSNLAAATYSAVPENPQFIKVVLYKLKEEVTDSGSVWSVSADYRNLASLILYA